MSKASITPQVLLQEVTALNEYLRQRGLVLAQALQTVSLERDALAKRVAELEPIEQDAAAINGDASSVNDPPDASAAPDEAADA